MKFVCDRCQTKYSIADEKVRGKILKVRCKSCTNIITVREEVPAPAPGCAHPPAVRARFAGGVVRGLSRARPPTPAVPRTPLGATGHGADRAPGRAPSRAAR